ncbi:hypothetical protein [uncultured Mediterranean phage uvMED]|nr:hypothetical protein [uncultured Mediterranean phage uvMED]
MAGICKLTVNATVYDSDRFAVYDSSNRANRAVTAKTLKDYITKQGFDPDAFVAGRIEAGQLIMTNRRGDDVVIGEIEVKDLLRTTFNSITERDSYFSEQFSRLVKNDIILIHNQSAVELQIWTGDNEPSVYNPAFWALSSFKTSDSSIEFGTSSKIGNAGHGISIETARNEKGYILQSNITDAGSDNLSYFYFPESVEKLEVFESNAFNHLGSATTENGTITFPEIEATLISYTTAFYLKIAATGTLHLKSKSPSGSLVDKVIEVTQLGEIKIEIEGTLSVPGDKTTFTVSGVELEATESGVPYLAVDILLYGEKRDIDARDLPIETLANVGPLEPGKFLAVSDDGKSIVYRSADPDANDIIIENDSVSQGTAASLNFEGGIVAAVDSGTAEIYSILKARSISSPTTLTKLDNTTSFTFDNESEQDLLTLPDIANLEEGWYIIAVSEEAFGYSYHVKDNDDNVVAILLGNDRKRVYVKSGNWEVEPLNYSINIKNNDTSLGSPTHLNFGDGLDAQVDDNQINVINKTSKLYQDNELRLESNNTGVNIYSGAAEGAGPVDMILYNQILNTKAKWTIFGKDTDGSATFTMIENGVETTAIVVSKSGVVTFPQNTRSAPVFLIDQDVSSENTKTIDADLVGQTINLTQSSGAKTLMTFTIDDHANFQTGDKLKIVADDQYLNEFFTVNYYDSNGTLHVKYPSNSFTMIRNDIDWNIEEDGLFTNVYLATPTQTVYSPSQNNAYAVNGFAFINRPGLTIQTDETGKSVVRVDINADEEFTGTKKFKSVNENGEVSDTLYEIATNRTTSYVQPYYKDLKLQTRTNNPIYRTVSKNDLIGDDDKSLQQWITENTDYTPIEFVERLFSSKVMGYTNWEASITLSNETFNGTLPFGYTQFRVFRTGGSSRSFMYLHNKESHTVLYAPYKAGVAPVFRKTAYTDEVEEIVNDTLNDLISPPAPEQLIAQYVFNSNIDKGYINAHRAINPFSYDDTHNRISYDYRNESNSSGRSLFQVLTIKDKSIGYMMLKEDRLKEALEASSIYVPPNLKSEYGVRVPSGTMIRLGGTGSPPNNPTSGGKYDYRGLAIPNTNPQTGAIIDPNRQSNTYFLDDDANIVTDMSQANSHFRTERVLGQTALGNGGEDMNFALRRGAIIFSKDGDKSDAFFIEDGNSPWYIMTVDLNTTANNTEQYSAVLYNNDQSKSIANINLYPNPLAAALDGDKIILNSQFKAKSGYSSVTSGGGSTHRIEYYENGSILNISNSKIEVRLLEGMNAGENKHGYVKYINTRNDDVEFTWFDRNGNQTTGHSVPSNCPANTVVEIFADYVKDQYYLTFGQSKVINTLTEDDQLVEGLASGFLYAKTVSIG